MTKPIIGKPKAVLKALDTQITQGMTKKQLTEWESEKAEVEEQLNAQTK